MQIVVLLYFILLAIALSVLFTDLRILITPLVSSNSSYFGHDIAETFALGVKQQSLTFTGFTLFFLECGIMYCCLKYVFISFV